MFKAKVFYISLLLFSIILLHQGCEDSILVGTEILDNEKITVDFTDSVKMNSKTIDGVRLKTHTPGVNSITYLVGELNDPEFGKVNAQTYLTNRLITASPPDYPTTTKTVTFDSLVLVLTYDSTASYPVLNTNHLVELFQLKEKFTLIDTFYSDVNPDYYSDPIASKVINIRPKDSVDIISHTTGDTVTLAPHMRLRLNTRFGRSLLFDPTAIIDDTSFMNVIKGFLIKSKPIDVPSMYGFNFSDAALSTSTNTNRLIMYYTVDDTIKKEYQYPIVSTTFSKFSHDIVGSAAEKAIQSPELSQGPAYLQALGGVKTVVSFEDLSALRGKLINKVELDIYVQEQIGQNPTYEQPLRLIASHLSSSGKQEFIKDISQLVNIGVSFVDAFGGALNTSGSVKKYTLNITNHIKEVLKDPTYSSDLQIGILNEAETARRAIFYGAKDSNYPMKLRVSYTEL